VKDLRPDPAFFIYMNYADKFKDPRWQKVRLKKLEGAEWACEKCMDTETMLSVHHKRYIKGRKPWEYEEHDLVVLCQPCHSEEHEAKDMQSELVARLHADGPASASDFFAVGAGYISQQTNDEGISAVAYQFYQESPYQFEQGRLLASLTRSVRMSFGDMLTISESLQGGDNPELAADLLAVFAKYGIKPASMRGQ